LYILNKSIIFMKKVEAIIRKSQFDDVKSALMNVKVTSLVTGRDWTRK